ncbi:MAG TPA: DUF1292 domain-containing protein [Atopostipes sp.]|jgi:uncharacterized protein YrzB (UPF0473 family)|nr:DUF1292 domain-containing protein [Atopostipes sp.]
MTDNHTHDNDHEYITLVDEDGNEELYQILLTFESEEFEKSYVLVHPTSTEDQEEVEIFAFSYTEADGGLDGQLGDIETDEEWDMIEEVLGAFIEEEEE